MSKLDCEHDFKGIAKQKVRLYCNHCGSPKELVDRIAELVLALAEISEMEGVVESDAKFAEHALHICEQAIGH